MVKVSLFDLEYIVFDLETTGLSPHQGAEIIEIGALKLRGGEPTGETFQTLVHIAKPIPKQASLINGILDQDLMGQPPIDVVFPKFLDFIGHRILIAHNASFDLEFIKKNLERFPFVHFLNFCIDTVELSKLLFSYEKGHNLDAIANRFAIKNFETEAKGRHRSLGDCTITSKIFGEFLKILKQRNMATLHDIRDCILNPPKKNLSHQQESLNLF